MMEIMIILFTVVCIFNAVTNCQEVAVTLRSEDSYEGDHTTLSCSYFIMDYSYAFYTLEWFKGESVSGGNKIAEFFLTATSPIYSDGYDQSRYSASRDIDNSSSTLDILNVEYSTDGGGYLCRVTVVPTDGSNSMDEIALTDLIVYILPTSIHLSDSTEEYPSDGGTSYLVEGEGRQYTCQVPDINPEATFSWTVGNQPLTPDGNENDVGADGLITSRSTATLTATWSNHGEMLKCQASNKDGNPGISISVTLDVKVPPKSSAMSLLDSSGGSLGDPVDVVQGVELTLTCKVPGTRPAATIGWFLNDVEQTTTTASPGGSNRLVDTEGDWTFTPERVNHRQMVKCEANTAESETPFPSVSTTLNVIVFPSNITFSDSTGTLYPSTWGTSYLVEGDHCQYTCEVPDINPGASFTWTVGDQELNHSDSNVTDSDGFTTSTSTSSLLASFEHHHGQDLKCLAINKEGTNGKSVNVTVDIKVPPKDSSVSLSDSSSGLDPGASVSVNQDEEQTLTCTVRGSRPAATINLYRDGTVEETKDRMVEGNGLLDTSENFVFTPQRDYHRQLVKCEAKTNDSKMPYPAANITLDVDGPPDTPVISGSMTMTENVATTLTCTADLGYPEDWTLEWSNEGTAIGNPSDTTAALSGTSQRYMFTSQLEFTPNRKDNTHNITCTAKKNSWTSPEKTWGPIDVQYETSITNKDKTYVRIRSRLTANLSCIAKGNPVPVMTWFDPNKTEIINGGDDNKYMVEVSYTTSDPDMTSGHVTISKLTIQAVNPEVDYGVYTCYSTNDIGRPDSHEIILNGTRRPNKPTGVVRTDRTSSSIAVRWTAGDDGGETQWFHVSHETSDSPEIFSDKIEGGVTTYNVSGLESYTQYEIRVYAESDVEINPNPGSIVEYTSPVAPTSDMDFSLLYNVIEGTVIIEGLNDHGGCIQLEVKYEGIADWKTCGHCIATDGNVDLSFWCLQTRKRRRRAVGDVEVVRARLCQMHFDVQLCSDPIGVMEVQNPVTDQPASSSTGVIVGVTIGVITLVAIVFLLGMFFERKFKNKNGPEQVNMTLQRKQRSRGDKLKDSGGTSVYQEVTEMAIVESTNPDQSAWANTAYANVISKDKAFPRDMLTIVKELGHGAFGQVFLAEANGIIERSKVTLVAVKTLKEGACTIDKKDMMQELDLMQKLLDHCNVVKLLGYSVEQDPPYIIVEYLSRGNLKDLLKDSRSKGGRVYGNLHGVSRSLTSRDLLKFANDVADGMHFISSQKCIHRDLATRNILVAEDMICKVSDFGLARDVIDNRAYERQSQGRLPLRWMALESVLDDVYTPESDVWSFGVLLWEIVTLGSRPYPSMSAKTMIDELQQGYRMPKPNQCQEELYQMMLKCWTEDPKSRPNFKEIGDELCKLGRQGKELISIRAYEEMTYEVTIPMSDQEKV